MQWLLKKGIADEERLRKAESLEPKSLMVMGNRVQAIVNDDCLPVIYRDKKIPRGFYCNCGDYQFRRSFCKHLISLLTLVEGGEDRRLYFELIPVVSMTDRRNKERMERRREERKDEENE